MHYSFGLLGLLFWTMNVSVQKPVSNEDICWGKQQLGAGAVGGKPKKVLGLILHLSIGVCMPPHGFSPGTPAVSHTPKHSK